MPQTARELLDETARLLDAIALSGLSVRTVNMMVDLRARVGAHLGEPVHVGDTEGSVDHTGG